MQFGGRFQAQPAEFEIEAAPGEAKRARAFRDIAAMAREHFADDVAFDVVHQGRQRLAAP